MLIAPALFIVHSPTPLTCKEFLARFWFLKVVLLKIQVLWDVTPFRIVSSYQHIRRSYCVGL